MMVNAFFTKCFALSQRWIIKDLNCGKWYAGSSIMKGGTSPRIVVLRMISTVIIAVAIPKTYIPKVMRSALPIPKCCTIPPAIAVKMGNFAPQEKNGMTRMVAVLSFSSAKVRVLTMAGMEQPKPMIMGINALPERPNLLKILSKINATRAI